MKRVFFVLLLGLTLLTPVAFSQGEAPPESRPGAGGKASEAAGEGGLEVWRWANFVLLVAGLGYLAAKFGGPFFQGRARQIRQEMMDAEEERKAAEKRAAEVDRRLANLESDIQALRAESQKEASSEQERMRQQTATEMVKIRAHAEQEIASAGKAARLELKKYSAELAVALAEQKLRARITPDTQEALVRGFVRDLDSSQAPVNQ
jgi:F-type H+-transporting ATPase subunit b